MLYGLLGLLLLECCHYVRGQTSISCEETASGSISDGGSASYDITLSTAQYMTVSLCGSDFDTIVTIYDSSGSSEASNDDFCGWQSAVQTSLLSADTYTITITGWSGESGDYELAVSCGDNSAPDYPTVAGTQIDSDCAFFDDGNFPPVAIGECWTSSDDGSAKFECNDAGDGIIYTEYNGADCSGASESANYTAYSYFEYNCDGTSDGCDLLTGNQNCDGDASSFNVLENWCSLNNYEYECVDGAPAVNIYSDSDCTNLLSSEEIDSTGCTITCAACSLNKFAVFAFAFLVVIVNIYTTN